MTDYDTCSSAAFEGHLDCLKYAHENGCEWDYDTTSSQPCVHRKFLVAIKKFLIG